MLPNRCRLLLVMFSGWMPGLALANPLVDGFVDEYLSDTERLSGFCQEKFPDLPINSCKALVEAGVKSVTGGEVDKKALQDTLDTDLHSPEFLNHVLTKLYGRDVPLGLEFKNLDASDGESLLGLSYAIDKKLVKVDRPSSERWNSRSTIAFNANGTLTSDSDKNPRNFLDTRLAVAYAWSSRIPIQSDAFGQSLTEAAIAAAPLCAGPGAGNSDACRAAKRKGFALLDNISDYLNAFQFYQLGIDAGYESDQRFDAQQSRFGAFVFGQYEAWGTNSLLGALGLTPAIRLGVDKVEPNDETPRAMAGDNSAFYRYTGELSLWMPVGSHFGQNLAFTINYRHWGEIDPATVVSNAGLDKYSLRSFSLTSPSGLFVSYSSGKLPLDVRRDDVVELGWKTYF